MDIIISNASGQPIYDQIYTQIRALILNGTLKEGDTLPSMRLLAKELRISVITTKRAYEELERDGFIETVTGKGSFVGKNNLEFVREEHLKSMEQHLIKAIYDGKMASLTLLEVQEILAMLYNERSEEE